MRFLRYIFCALLFVTAAVADTININWVSDGETYAQTTCEIGGDVILPTTPTKRGYTFKGWLTGYTLLEYIESTGTQYIDTGYNLDTNNFIIKTKIKETETATAERDFCGNQDRSSNRFVVGLYDSTVFAYDASAVNAQHKLIRTNDNEITCVYDGDTKKRYIIVNGIKGDEVAFSKNIYPSKNTIKVFQDGNNAFYTKCRMKYLQLISNGIIKRNFIPARRDSDGVVGMYDFVSGQFFTNAGTGEFIAGPVAENQNFYE